LTPTMSFFGINIISQFLGVTQQIN
jgi:hypothetical protein